MRDEGLYLDDIVDAAESIQRFVAGLSKDEFLESDLVQSAIIQKLTVIGEAASRISESTRSRYPKIDWKKLRGFRNIAVHVYYELDWDVVWETATVNVPILLKKITKVIETDFPFVDENPLGSESN